MEMAFFEPLPNHKQLKHCVLTLWFKDSGGTTKKRGLSLSSVVLRCISTKYSVFLFVLYTHLGRFGAVESVQIKNTFEKSKSVPELASN